MSIVPQVETRAGDRAGHPADQEATAALLQAAQVPAPSHVPPAGRPQYPGHPGQDALATDPVCGMSISPATAPEHRGTGARTVYFCSAHCAATFDVRRTVA